MSHAEAYTINELIEAIRDLTPNQRRQLQKRLHASGLFVPETLLTDQNPLLVAPALGVKRTRKPVTVKNSRMVTPLPVPATAATPLLDGNYRSPVSGKVVVAPLADAPRVDDPHAMQPLPGQAPEQPIAIIFDGGSKGNPGQGYGSYTLHWPGAQPQIVRLRFGSQATNNEAEYDTLIASLEALHKRLQDNGAAPATAKLDIRGDSLLVINQVQGTWQCKEARLQTRRDQVRKLLQAFGSWQLTHHDREHSVRALGH